MMSILFVKDEAEDASEEARLIVQKLLERDGPLPKSARLVSTPGAGQSGMLKNERKKAQIRY